MLKLYYFDIISNGDKKVINRNILWMKKRFLKGRVCRIMQKRKI